MAEEQLCPVCGCQIGAFAYEKDSVLYCCEPCAESVQCDCGCCETVEEEVRDYERSK